jgi:outer membrane protein
VTPRHAALRGLPILLLLSAGSPALAQTEETPADEPESQPPPVELPGPAGQRQGASLARVTFADAIKRALARNPNVVAAQADIARAEALVRQARSTFLPTLSANFTYTRLDSDRIFPGTTPPRVIAPADTENVNGALTVPLVSTRNWLSWSRSKEGVSIARASAAEVKRQLALATARAYLAVLAQHRTAEVVLRALENAKAHLRFASTRLAAGAGNKLDVARAGQESATDEAQFQNAQAGLARAQQALGVLLAVDGPLDVEQEPAFGALPAPDKAIDEVVNRRGDLQAQAARVTQARRAVNDAWTDYMPLLTGAFSPWYQNPASLTTPTTGWSAQLIFSWPLYDGGLRYGQQRERQAVLASAQATVENLLRTARSEVRTAFTVLRHADRAAAAAREASRLGQEAFSMANRAYQAGATNSLDLIDAARRSRDGDTAAVIADDAARQARLDLLVAAGRFP